MAFRSLLVFHIKCYERWSFIPSSLVLVVAWNCWHSRIVGNKVHPHIIGFGSSIMDCTFIILLPELRFLSFYWLSDCQITMDENTNLNNYRWGPILVGLRSGSCAMHLMLMKIPIFLRFVVYLFQQYGFFFFFFLYQILILM